MRVDAATAKCHRCGGVVDIPPLSSKNEGSRTQQVEADKGLHGEDPPTATRQAPSIHRAKSERSALLANDLSSTCGARSGAQEKEKKRAQGRRHNTMSWLKRLFGSVRR